MKQNKVTFTILTACIASFIIEITGLFSIGIGLKNIFKYYDELIVEGIENTKTMDNIRKLITQEQSVSSIYVLSTTDAVLEEYEVQEKKIRNELTQALSEFGLRMKGNEKEQIFHNIMSGCYSVYSEIDIIMTLRKTGSKEIAEQFISKSLVKAYNELNRNLEELCDYIDSEMKKAQAYMESYKKISMFSVSGTIVLILFTLIGFISICIKITYQLEDNKKSLQREVLKQTEKILEQNKKIIDIQEQTIYGMANIIESRDSDTGEHVKRTSLYVELIVKTALEEGYKKELLTPGYVEHLMKAAPLHDVGKIAVSDTILKKPGRLTAEEFESIKLHTTAGGKIIEDVLGKIESEGYVRIASEVATSHHERWDGTGYPMGLKEEEIPLCARIMAIADVFDALVSPRCYKDPFTPNQAFSMIEASKGSHFDPVLADMFLKKKSEVIKILSMN